MTHKRTKISTPGSLLLHIAAWLLYGATEFLTIMVWGQPLSLKGIAAGAIISPLLFYTQVAVFIKVRGTRWPYIVRLTFFFLVIAISAAAVAASVNLIGLSGSSKTSLAQILVPVPLLSVLYYLAGEATSTSQRIELLQEEKKQLERMAEKRELEYARLRQREERLEQERLSFEYAFLRAQVNPHFLHNILNALYSQAEVFPGPLAENIRKLSALMRYSLERTSQEIDKVPVEDEITHLRLFLDMHLLRFPKIQVADFMIKGVPMHHTVPPLAFITVVENALKHGDLKDPAIPLRVKLVMLPRELFFSCLNKKKETPSDIPSLKTGIRNLENRLEKAYSGKYKLFRHDAEGTYTFEITIKS